MIRPGAMALQRMPCWRTASPRSGVSEMLRLGGAVRRQAELAGERGPGSDVYDSPPPPRLSISGMACLQPSMGRGC